MFDRRQFLAAGLAAAAAGPAAVQLAVRVAQARADTLLKGQGLRRGSVAERLRALAKDERWLYPDSDAGRAAAVAEMNRRIAAPGLRAAFDGPMPAAEVRLAPAGRAGYREPGAYYIDLKDIRTRPAWTLPSVAFHEVIPGHLLQMGVTGQPAAAPLFEGWAIYAEQLAADLGAYAGDPMGEIGYLQWRLFRLGRVVVDDGLHRQGWSRDRAIAELTALQGQSIAFISIEADVDRIAANPGRYGAEGLRALAIGAGRPRERARWPAYHRAVLAGG
jgi:uncharacterized protein (DUF885 family)